MMKLPLDQIICHDVVKGIPLPDRCVDVVITSPPYWGLRDYGISVQSVFGGDPKCEHKWGEKLIHKKTGDGQKETPLLKGRDLTGINSQKELNQGNFCQSCGAWRGQLGLEPHPQMYVDHLVQICCEIRRVLKKSGSFYLNLGDTYYGGGGKTGRPEGRDDLESSRLVAHPSAEYQKIKNRYRSHWLQPKQLLGIPWRVAIALQEDGWLLRNAVIWNKLNHMPSSVKDRFACGYEFVFLFVKNQKYYFDLDAVREPHKAVSLNRAKYEFKLMPRAWQNGRTPIPGGQNVDIAPHHSGKNPGDVVLENWGTDKNQEYHGEGKRNPMGQSPSDLKRNIIESYKKNPKGKNPGDVLALEHHRHHGSNLSNVATYYGDQIPKYCHENGKNPSDFWSLTTQPFTGYSDEFEHFAVFPEELVVRPLLASCPKFICKKCGKPREKIIQGTSSEAFNIRVRDVKEKRIKHTDRVASEEEVEKYQEGITHVGTGKVTVGFTDCGCNAGFDSGVILDPFCGRGTVGKVAKKLGLHYILIDIKPEYCELAKLYIAGQKYKLHKDQKKLKTL